MKMSGRRNMKVAHVLSLRPDYNIYRLHWVEDFPVLPFVTERLVLLASLPCFRTCEMGIASYHIYSYSPPCEPLSSRESTLTNTTKGYAPFTAQARQAGTSSSPLAHLRQMGFNTQSQPARTAIRELRSTVYRKQRCHFHLKWHAEVM